MPRWLVGVKPLPMNPILAVAHDTGERVRKTTKHCEVSGHPTRARRGQTRKGHLAGTHCMRLQDA
eukprot:scaffold239626_cov36-Tisochrysis_lutea.AAC.2